MALSLLTIAALVLAPAGPARAAAPDTAAVYAHIGEVTSLDPAGPYDAVSQSAIYNVYETLLAFKGGSMSDFEPRLAVEVPSRANGGLSADGKTYRFKIRKGVAFHGGGEMTPEDVRYSLLRFMLSDRTGGPSSLLLEPLLGVGSTRDASGKRVVRFEDAAAAVRVEGDSVVLKLQRPFAPLLSILARWSYVVSRKGAAARGGWDGSAETWERHNDPAIDRMTFFNEADGTGPFKLERWDKQARLVVLARNEAYWRAPAALERVIYRSIPEFATRRLMLQGRDVDIAEVPFPMAQQLQGLSGLRVDDALPRLATDPVLFFTLDISTVANPDVGSGRLDGKGIPPDFFQDLDVRKAFQAAFDYEAYLRDAYRGKAARAAGPVPAGLSGRLDPKEAPKFDLSKAEAHLRKAWGGAVWEKGFVFTMSYNTGGDVREAACQILKKNIEALNPKFQVRLRPVDWAAFVDRTQRRLMPLWARGWIADYPDPHNFAFPFLHSQGRYGAAQALKDPALDAMIDAAQAETDPKKRARAYQALQRRANDRAYQIYGGHPPGVYAYQASLEGFVDNAVFMGPYFYPIRKK